MTDQPIVAQLIADLQDVLDRYHEAKLLSNAELIGAMHLLIADIISAIQDED